jgi:predicted DNA-binding protein
MTEMTTVVRMREDTKLALRDLAKASGRPMSDVLADAVESYRRTVFLARAADAYATARRLDPDVDRALWESTVADGLTD